MKNKPTLKRIVAYIIDIMIVSIISSLFASIENLNPKLYEYNEAYEKYTEYIQDITSNSDSVDANELLNGEKINDYTYEITSLGVVTSEITLIISILYFIIFQYYNNGKTIGKALLKIQVKSIDNKKLKLKQLIFRSLIINSIITSLASIICLLTLSKSNYLMINSYIQIIDMAIMFITFGMIIIREDGRGLHDILAKTIVIESNETTIIKKLKGN